MALKLPKGKLTVLVTGIAGILWMPLYNTTHPIQRAGDDWYGPYVFFVGIALISGLLALIFIQRPGQARA